MLAVWVIFLVSLIPFPLTYILSSQKWMVEPVTIILVGVLALIIIFVVPLYFVSRERKPDFILYVMSLFMFSSMIDLIIALESDGYIPELMHFYLKEGEAYLWSPYGIVTNYWDASVHYGCCLWMLYCVNKGQSYKKVGLFWVGSMANSLIVLITGSVVGKFAVKFAILLNLPYFFVPLWIGYRLLKMKDRSQTVRMSAPSRLFDYVFIVYFLYAGIVDLLRGCIVLGSQLDVMVEYGWDHEPYLKDPVAYPKVQMLVYLFYFLPFYGCAICGLFNGRQSWLKDLALLYAGMAAQGQIVHIGASFHYKTDPEFIVPDRGHSRNIFWLINLPLFIVPFLFAVRENYRTTEERHKLQ